MNKQTTPIAPKLLIDRVADKLAHQLLMEEIAEGWIGYGAHHITEVVNTFEGVLVILPLYND